MLRGLGRSLYESILVRKPTFPKWMHGGIAYRRREYAMSAQFCGSFRLGRAGAPRATRYHDATNALYSVKKHHIVAVGKQITKQGMERCIEQGIQNSTHIVLYSAHMHNAEGALPAYHASIKACVNAHAHGVQLAISCVARNEWQRMLQ
eukprot:1271985-Pyramimonas_sp.AAC.1